MITCKSWVEELDYTKIYLPEYNDGNIDWETPPNSGVVYVSMDEIDKFFRLCKLTDNKYVVVSACSDYGLSYQDDNPVSADMAKWLKMCDTSKLGYSPFITPARCQPEWCKIDDMYSVKIYSWTKYTFDTIPENITRWYMTNCNVVHEKITPIPFGGNTEKVEVEKFYKDYSEKEQLIYLNFSNSTNERFVLKGHLGNLPICKMQNDFLPYAEYLEEMSSCLFTLCPNGNGLDCYRTWESLAVGSIPIIQKGHWSREFQSLPLICCDYSKMQTDFLLEEYERIRNTSYDGNMLDINWWKEQING